MFEKVHDSIPYTPLGTIHEVPPEVPILGSLNRDLFFLSGFRFRNIPPESLGWVILGSPGCGRTRSSERFPGARGAGGSAGGGLGISSISHEATLPKFPAQRDNLFQFATQTHHHSARTMTIHFPRLFSKERIHAAKVHRK